MLTITDADYKLSIDQVLAARAESKPGMFTPSMIINVFKEGNRQRITVAWMESHLTKRELNKYDEEEITKCQRVTEDEEPTQYYRVDWANTTDYLTTFMRTATAWVKDMVRVFKNEKARRLRGAPSAAVAKAVNDALKEEKANRRIKRLRALMDEKVHIMDAQRKRARKRKRLVANMTRLENEHHRLQTAKRALFNDTFALGEPVEPVPRTMSETMYMFSGQRISASDSKGEEAVDSWPQRMENIAHGVLAQDQCPPTPSNDDLECHEEMPLSPYGFLKGNNVPTLAAALYNSVLYNTFHAIGDDVHGDFGKIKKKVVAHARLCKARWCAEFNPSVDQDERLIKAIDFAEFLCNGIISVAAVAHAKYSSDEQSISRLEFVCCAMQDTVHQLTVKAKDTLDPPLCDHLITKFKLN